MTVAAVFTDFDGVHHPAAEVLDYEHSGIPLSIYAKERQLFRWTPILAELLQDRPDVMLVVHSGWRTRCQDYELRQYLGELGPWFAGSTPVGGRYQSIMKIVERFGIDEFIVLDDAIREFPPGWPPLIPCDPEQGLSAPGTQHQIRQWLSRIAARPSPVPTA